MIVERPVPVTIVYTDDQGGARIEDHVVMAQFFEPDPAEQSAEPAIA